MIHIILDLKLRKHKILHILNGRVLSGIINYTHLYRNASIKARVLLFSKNLDKQFQNPNNNL